MASVESVHRTVASRLQRSTNTGSSGYRGAIEVIVDERLETPGKESMSVQLRAGGGGSQVAGCAGGRGIGDEYWIMRVIGLRRAECTVRK